MSPVQAGRHRQLPHLERLRSGTLSRAAVGLRFHANLHEDKCGRPTEELGLARRAAANPLRSVLQDAKWIEKNLKTTNNCVSKQQAAKFPSRTDLKAANEQPLRDETGAKFSFENPEELLGLAFSSAKVWLPGKGAKQQPAGPERNL